MRMIIMGKDKSVIKDILENTCESIVILPTSEYELLVPSDKGMIGKVFNDFKLEMYGEDK